MRITKRQLRRIIREAFDENDKYFAAVRSPEAQEALVAAGFDADGTMPDPRRGLGPAQHGMYTPQNMEDVMGWIEAAISINEALQKALRDLEDGVYGNAQDAFYEIIYPVQRSFGKYGAADTEGRETSGAWLERQGWDWE